MLFCQDVAIPGRLLSTVVQLILIKFFRRPEVLEQYAVLSGQYYRLCEELRDELHHIVLFPESLPPDANHSVFLDYILLKLV